MNTEFINLYHQQVFLHIWNPLYCKLVPFVHSVLMPLKPTSFAKSVSPEIPGLVNFSAEKFTIISIPKLNFMERNHLIARNDTLGTPTKIKTRPPFVWVGSGGHFNTCVIFWYPESSQSLPSIPTRCFSRLPLPVVATEISVCPGWPNIRFLTVSQGLFQKEWTLSCSPEKALLSVGKMLWKLGNAGKKIKSFPEARYFLSLFLLSALQLVLPQWNLTSNFIFHFWNIFRKKSTLADCDH